MSVISNLFVKNYGNKTLDTFAYSYSEYDFEK